MQAMGLLAWVAKPPFPSVASPHLDWRGAASEPVAMSSSVSCQSYQSQEDRKIGSFARPDIATGLADISLVDIPMAKHATSSRHSPIGGRSRL